MIKKKYKAFARYLYAGLLAYSIEIGILFFLNNILNINPILAVSISFWISVFTTFYLQKIIAFGDFTRTVNAISKQFSIYVGLLIFNYFVSVAIVSVLPDSLAVVGRSVVIVLSMMWNYYIYKNYIFHKGKNDYSKLIVLLVIFLCSVVLFYIVALGIYIRPMSDDFAFLGAVNTLSGIDYLKFVFSANGRVTALVSYFIGYSIPLFLIFVPLLGTVLLYFGLLKFIDSLFHALNLKSPKIVTLTLPLIIITASYLLIITYGLYASTFWFASAPVHTWSYAILFMYIGFVIDALHNKFKYSKPKIFLLFILLPFMAATLNETTAILAIVVSGISVLYAIRYKITNMLNYFIGLASSFAGLLTLYFAPGAIARRAVFENRYDYSFIHRAINTPSYIFDDVTNNLAMALKNEEILFVVLGLSIFIGTMIKGKIKLKQILLTVAGVLFILCTLYFVNTGILYFMTERPIVPLRMYLLPALIYSISVMIFGLFIGVYSNVLSNYRRGILVGASLMLVFLPILHSYANVSTDLTNLQTALKTRKIHFDYRSNYIYDKLDNNICLVNVETLKILGVGDVTDDINNYDNYNIYFYYSRNHNLKSSFNHQNKKLVCGILAE